MNLKLILFFLSLLGSFLLALLPGFNGSFSAWLDAAFLVGLLLIMISCSMILIEGKFFAAFIHSAKNFFTKINKKEQLIRESEKRTLEPVEFAIKLPARKTFFQVGMLFCLLSFLFSSAIYFF